MLDVLMFLGFGAVSLVVTFVCSVQMTKVAIAYPKLMRGLKGSIEIAPVVGRCAVTFCFNALLLLVFFMVMLTYTEGATRAGGWFGLALGALLGLPSGVDMGGDKKKFYDTFTRYIDASAKEAFAREEAEKAAAEAAAAKPPAQAAPAAAPPVPSPAPDIAAPAAVSDGYDDLSREQLLALLRARDRVLENMQALLSPDRPGMQKPAPLPVETPEEAPATPAVPQPEQPPLATGPEPEPAPEAPKPPACALCGGALRHRPVTFRAVANSKTITVLLVPMQVCRACGRTAYAPEVEQQLEAIVEAHKGDHGQQVFVDWPG